MKVFILIIAVLMPGLVFAGTQCRVTEFSDYYEVVCIGDEKAVPAPEASYKTTVSPTTASQAENTPAKPANRSTLSARSSFTSQIAATAPSTVSSTGAQQTVTAPTKTMIIPKNTLPAETSTGSAISPSGIVHRQGRQQYNRALQDAIAARLQQMTQ